MTLKVQRPDFYRGTRKENLKVTEVGRFNDLQEPMTVWSVHSGDEIPPNCKIPELNPPTSGQLPLSLRTERTGGGICKETYAVERILTWAEATGYSLENVDIVAGRNILRRISQTLYHTANKFTWRVMLHRHKNTLFLELIEAYAKEKMYGPATNIDASWAMVFEDMMKTGGKGTPGYECQDTNIRVPRLVELGSIRILSSGKVHSQTTRNDQDTLSNYVDVKLWSEFDPSLAEPHQHNFLKDARKRDTWTQCALLGIETVFWGERSEDGDLTALDEYWTEDLERRGKFWKPERILSFLEGLLVWLKDNTENGLSYTLNNDGEGDLVLQPAEHDDLKRMVQGGFPAK